MAKEKKEDLIHLLYELSANKQLDNSDFEMKKSSSQ